MADKKDAKESTVTEQVTKIKVLITQQEEIIKTETAEEAKATEEAKAAKPTSSTPRAPKKGGPPVDIKLFSAPLGIQVLVDGKSIGKTPKKLTIASGAHTVVFVDGDKKIRKSINVTTGGKTKWTYKQASGSVH